MRPYRSWAGFNSKRGRKGSPRRYSDLIRSNRVYLVLLITLLVGVSVAAPASGAEVACYGLAPTPVEREPHPEWGGEIIRGTDGDDVIIATDEGDLVYAGGGNDKVCGLDGGDNLYGQDGHDRLDGGEEGWNRLYGGAGDDELTVATSESGNDLVDDHMWGGAGDDKLYVGVGAARMHGGPGDDLLDAGSGPWSDFSQVTYAGSGPVELDLVSGVAKAADGTDTVVNVRIVQGSGKADVLVGDSHSNWLSGGEGPDVIRGGGAADDITGGVGRDRLAGGAGNDRIRGGRGDDQIWGHRGNDALYGDRERDTLRGGSGRDYLAGLADFDEGHGGPHADTCYKVERRSSCRVISAPR